MYVNTSIHHPQQVQARPRDPQQVSPGGDQMLAFERLNDTGERDEYELRRKVFDLNIRLMIAEGLARDAETAARTAQEEAQIWMKRFEEAESYKTRYEEVRDSFGLQD
jgi:hypothetical protein